MLPNKVLLLASMFKLTSRCEVLKNVCKSSRLLALTPHFYCTPNVSISLPLTNLKGGLSISISIAGI